MPFSARPAFVLPAALLLIALAGPAGAGPLVLKSADSRGVTLELQVGSWSLGPADAQGRSTLLAPGLEVYAGPGRPLLPYAHALVAIPPGARPTVSLVDQGGAELREGVRVQIGDKPVFHQTEPGKYEPAAEPVDPIVDGLWPAEAVTLGAPFELRGQRLVAVSVHPFRYDPAQGRLTVERHVVVRVDFGSGAAMPGGGPPREDRFFESVLRGAVLNYQQGRAWRRVPGTMAAGPGGTLFGRRPGVFGGGAFDESAPEVRVRVDTTAVYALTYNQLALSGYPSGVPIAEVSVHRHEFLPGATPPYETIELPIEVDDVDQNGVFGPGDRIVVFVQTWQERANPTIAERVWGGGEVVYATRLPGGTGLRMPSRPGWRALTGLTPPTSYPWTQRWEKNLNYYGFPPDLNMDHIHWTSYTFYAYYVSAAQETMRFEANDLDTSKAVTLSINFVGRQPVQNVLFAQVRNGSGQLTTICDSTNGSWTGKLPFTVSKTLFGSSLTEGLTNRWRIYGRTGPSAPDPNNNYTAPAGVNYFDVNYWRAYRALRGYLDSNSGALFGDYQIHATGFPSKAVRIYDVTTPAAPIRLDVDSTHVIPVGPTWDIEFQDSTLSGPRRYLVFTDPRMPPAAAFGAVNREHLTSRSAGDYLLILPEAFRTAAAPLQALRESQNMSVVLAPVEAVNDEFNGGRRSSAAIRRFIQYAYSHWGARFALLLGDGSLDPQNSLRNSGTDWVPTQPILGPVPVAEGLEVVPSDNWYSICIADTCDYFDPILPDLFVGRLPARSLQEANDMVSKVVNYENLTGDQSWRRNMLLVSDDAFSGLSTFGNPGGGSGYCHHDYEERFRLLDESLRSIVLGEAGLLSSNVEVFNVRYYLPNEMWTCCSPDTCRTDLGTAQTHARSTITPALMTRLNAGQLWWNYQGHANQWQMAHEQIFMDLPGSRDPSFLRNDAKPFLFSGFSCHLNAFASPGEASPQLGVSVGEDLLAQPNRGAIASWASSGFEIVPRNGTDHINTTWGRAMFTDPPIDSVYGKGGARVVLGESIGLGLIRYVTRPDVQAYPYERGIALTYELLGDPATQLSIGGPQIFATANGDSVRSDEPVILSPPRDSLLLESDIVSNVQVSSIQLLQNSTTGSIVVPESLYTLTPAFPDTVTGGQGGRHYHLSFRSRLSPSVYRYTIRAADRYGSSTDFNVLFQFLTVLRADGTPVTDRDLVPPTTALSLKALFPLPIPDPQTDLQVQVDGTTTAFTAVPADNDTTRRRWLLSWTHTPYTVGPHAVHFTAPGGLQRDHPFRVSGSGELLRDELAFPNPFDDDGTTFSFDLVTTATSQVLLRVFTVSGRLVYQREERGMGPGRHQLVWDGRDDEGQKLANGIYFYRLLARDGRASEFHQGSLVKLRKPRRNDVATP